ncbi:MAG: hypothetical protein EOP38_02330 [Rubrivivax sp.]|nr:MAG: hypothetical protein EOP38_02330 [Rubrivivax sp.]
MTLSRFTPSRRWLLTGLLAAATTASYAAAPDATAADQTDTTAHQHRAACVAALTSKAEPLVARMKGGDHRIEAELLGLTESGFALIGAAYRDGRRKPEADQLLDAAKKAQKAMPSAELAKLQSNCQSEGRQVLAEANMLERYLVTSAAKKRISRIAERASKTTEAR